MAADDPFDQVRREADPLRQAKLAGDLMVIYQQRAVELARLRREAINRAAAERDLSFSAIAAELGLTRGRISQIRQSAPPPERVFFGVGPVRVAVPLREVPGRALPMISSEDARAAERLTRLLLDLAFQVEQCRIPPDGRWEPSGDVVAICGPKSSPVTAQAIESDPFLSFAPDDGDVQRWVIRERDRSREHRSPMDEAPSSWADVAYVGRVVYDDRPLLVIAGVHALGSVGAVHYLTHHLRELFEQVGTHRFSMVVGSEHDGETVTRSDLVYPPRVHA